VPKVRLARTIALSPIKTKREPLKENAERPRIRLRNFDRCFCMANDGQDFRRADPELYGRQDVASRQDQQILSWEDSRLHAHSNQHFGGPGTVERSTVSGVARPSAHQNWPRSRTYAVPRNGLHL
jgi:hypothetical protein